MEIVMFSQHGNNAACHKTAVKPQFCDYAVEMMTTTNIGLIGKCQMRRKAQFWKIQPEYILSTSLETN